jgi:hypothetical protein
VDSGAHLSPSTCQSRSLDSFKIILTSWCIGAFVMHIWENPTIKNDVLWENDIYDVLQ